MRALVGVAMLASVAGPIPSALAQEPDVIEELVVVGKQDLRRFELAETIDVNPDSSVLLRDVVGAAVVRNGPLTSMAQYRGMSRFRVATHVNGAHIASGGPNWMDPPLSYAPAAHLEALEVTRGIASVSAGQETIGGSVKATTWRGAFSDDRLLWQGRARVGSGSVNGSSVVSGAVSVAGPRHLIIGSVLTERGDDAEFDGGDILPSEYRRDRVDVGYGLRTGNHTLRFDYGRNETGEAGTAALPMDIDYIDTDLWRASWEYAGEQHAFNAIVHVSDIEHGMTNYHLRGCPGQPWYVAPQHCSGGQRGLCADLAYGGLDRGTRWAP